MKIKATLEGHDAPIHLKGRVAWTLLNLHREKERGISTVDRPAPRWSVYVAALREKGFHIDTVREQHGGEYPGHHGRYFLRSDVDIQVLS